MIIAGDTQDPPAPPSGDESSAAEDRLTDELRKPLTVAFLLALAVGIIAVFVVRSPGLAVLAIFGYFAYGMWLPKSKRNTERFADSLYYLGFIFTLGALFVAMTPWFNNMGELKSGTIIEQFGIATATTFAGMTLRIILIQLRQTTTDQEEEAREAIAKYVRDLNREIGAALTEITEFRGRAAKMAEESIREIEREMASVRDAYTKFATHSNEAFSEVVDRAAIQFQDAMRDLTSRIGKIEVPGDAITARLGTASDSMVAAFDGIRSSLTSGSRELVSALDGVRSTLNAGSQELGQSLNESVSVAQRAAREIDEIQRAMASAYRKMAEGAAVSGEAASGAQRFTEDVRQTAVAMEQLRGRATELSERLSEVISESQTRGNVYRSEVDQARQLLQTVVTDIRSHGDAFTETVVESAKDLRDAIRDART